MLPPLFYSVKALAFSSGSGANELSKCYTDRQWNIEKNCIDVPILAS